MAIRVKFDNTNNVIWPTFVLATRNGTKLGVVNTTNESLTDNFNSKFELRFDAHKVDNDNENHIWDKLQNFKLLWCKEWDVWFEIYVEIEESDELVKSVECVSLGEAELSQILLHDIEINTEDDIARDDYVPTTLYNDSNPKASLLDRIMEKAPHYSVHHVDTSIANIQRTFSFDNTSIYDAFQDIAEEIGCIFIIDSGTDDNGNIKRQINVYDLESYCYDCGHRGDFRDVCPDCDSTNVQNGYGEDTTVFVSVDNLAESITYTTDTDSVKNCFKLEAGDDLMTATVINCNPNGSRYLWYISDEVKEDMSDELVAKLNEYDQEYEFFQNEYSMTIPSGLATQYNNIITKYSSYDSTLTNITNPIVGYSNLMNTYYDTIELYLLLHDTLMPSVETSPTTAESEAAKLTAAALSPVAVQNINSISVATASSAVLSMAKVLVNPNYQVKVGASSLNNKVWTGDFTITNYSDSEDTATSATVSITINGDYETFIRQKIEKSLNTSSNELAVDATSLFKLNLADFTVAIKQFCLVSLNAFSDACQSCMELLIEQGVANDETWANKNPNMYEEVYLPYYDKMSALQNEIKLRENEINVITGTTDINGGVLTDGIQTILEKHRANVHSALDFEAFLGTDLWLEFTAYRREDVYENSNYISDGLNNAELFKRANEFIEAASKEVYKSATLQHSISASLKDLLVMEEFAPITDKFAVGNWIRVKVNDEVFRLRLISYTLDFAKLEDLSIEFSDVKKYHDGVTDGESVLAQAASMASSYDAVTRQADKGSRANRQLTGWVNDGLALTKMKIVDSADNQNLTWDDHGLLCREYLPITDDYSDKQLKIINRGLYVTDDGWRTSKAGIGDFTYYNPETGLYEEAYGVIADTIVGNIILGDNIGIYNESGSFKVNENGLTLTSSATADNEHLLTIQKENGDGSYTKYVYIDQDGNVVLNAQSVRISSTQTVTSYVEETAESIASSTASNTLQTWVNGDFADTIHELQDGIVDAKIETFYQTTDPSAAWTTTGLKNSHAGDIWYNSSSSVQKYYRWNGTAWEEMRAMPPQAVIDTVDGKATIYTGTTTPTGMSEGDLWFQGTNQPILTYVNDEWVEYNKYSAAIQGVQNYINSIGEQVDGMAEIHYGTVTPTLNNSPASSWSDTATKDLHVDDLYYNTTDGYCYRFKKSGNTYSWERIKDSDITAAASAASDANDLADQKRRVFVSTPTPPYDRGDLWVEGENGDIWRCATPKTTGQSYAKSDWVKASKYTDDSAATNAYNYASDVMEYAQGLGGLIDDMVEIHYGTAVPTLSNSPASSWSDTTTKNAHLDDLYYDTTTGYCYRFTKSGSTYSWSRLKDKDITEAASLAGQKRRVFVGTSTPTPPYDVGDLWAQGPTGEILKCKKARTSGSYVESDWEKASKYTDDSALNDWIQNDFATTIETLEEGIVDAKVDTWYQASDPSTSWNTDALKSQHAGDIWYNSSSTVQKYYRWNGTAWEEMRATPPKAVMDTVDGKASIFTGTNPAPTGMQEGDLWFKGANEPILTYVGGQWIEYNKYSTAINGVKSYAETLGAQIDGIAEIHYGTITPALNTAPANSWSDTATKDLHVDDLYYNTTNGFCYRFTKNGSTYSWERIKDSDITAAASAASDANDLADQKRRVFVSQPTPPYDIGDLWVEGSTGDIWRCANSKSLGQSYAKSDWIKASKYTDDSAATAAMTYAEDVMDYAEGLGGLIDEMVEIHYGTAAPTLSNAPANTWSDTATKDSHLDDLYYDTATGYCYRFTKSGSTYSWTRLKDKDITAASNLAGQKRRVFVGTSNPTPPYDIGDLWAQGSTGDIMKCKTARASGSYNASDWEKASKYTDDSNLNAFINGDFATTVQSLQNGITDAKVETWYQTSDPSTSWNTATLKAQHTGDIWYNSTSSVQKYYRWSGSAWQEMTASPPDAVMNSIGGKATIFTGTNPAPSGMHEGDLWFKGQGEPILTYVNNQWVEYNKYTAAINGVKDYAEALGGQIDGMAEIHYGTVAPTLSNSPASSWSDTATKDLHVDDLYYDTASGYCYRFTKSGSTYSWVRIKDSDITAAASTASAANTLAGQKRRVFVSTPYTPYDIGDLWVQGSTGDIMKCKKARASGSYTASDWEKASKYTDDSTLTTWISGDFAATVESLQNGITDAKIETWYQDSDPSTAWTTTALKNQHTGDIWYNSKSTEQRYYRWNGTAWEEMRATPPKAVMDEVDGKATIFTGTDTPSNPNENDLWFKGQDEPILTYINGQWVEYNKYTDDSAVNNLEIGGRNLLRNTKDFAEATYTSTCTFARDAEGVTVITFPAYTGSVGWKGCTFHPNIPYTLIRNKTVTLSFWYRSDSWTLASGGHDYPLPSFEILANATDNPSGTKRLKYRTIYDSTVPAPTTEWQRFVQSYNITDSFFTAGSGTVTEDRYFTIQMFQHNLSHLQYKKIQLEIGNKVTDWTPAPEDVESSIQEYVTDLRGQIDGKAETWYQETDPSMIQSGDEWVDNWSASEKEQHIGDLWYRTTDSTTWYYDGTEWIQQGVPQNVFNAIDGKSQIFVSQPETPYKEGDLWIEGADGDILVCINSRESGNFVETDWGKASKYNDVGTGRNLIHNTNIIDLTSNSTRPNINGTEESHAFGLSAGNITVAEHGLRHTVTSATRPGINFGTRTTANMGMYRLEAGKTYTWSFDWAAKVLSGSPSSSSNYYMRAWCVYTTDGATNSTDIYQDVYIFSKDSTDDRGAPVNDRCEFTFTIPKDATGIWLQFSCNSTVDGNYATGDYVEISNIKLEEGTVATAWTPAVEDILKRFDSVENSIDETNAAITGFKSEVETWMDFRDGELIIGKKFEREVDEGTEEVKFATVIDAEKLAFKQNDEEVAYISSNKLYITNAEITTNLIIGKYLFRPHDNEDGGMSLVWNA